MEYYMYGLFQTSDKWNFILLCLSYNKIRNCEKEIDKMPFFIQEMYFFNICLFMARL